MLVEDRNIDITKYPVIASIAVANDLAVPLSGSG